MATSILPDSDFNEGGALGYLEPTTLMLWESGLQLPEICCAVLGEARYFKLAMNPILKHSEDKMEPGSDLTSAERKFSLMPVKGQFPRARSWS